MDWPYHFLDLTEKERHHRRKILDKYATYSQLSVFIPVAVLLFYRVVSRAIKKSQSRKGVYNAVPSSPGFEIRPQKTSGAWWTGARKVQWWLQTDLWFIGYNWGQRDQWIFASIWTLWILALCGLETKNDYMHLTKRFGSIAVAQFPIHYLLALKSLNPFAYIFGSSHEQMNRWHRVMGRIINLLLFLHGIFYLNYFWQVGILTKKLTSSSAVISGTAGLVLIDIINMTSWETVRRFSYRLFFLTHVTLAFILPPLIMFHVRHARIFMAEALLVLVADLVSRKMDTIASQAKFEFIPGTSLVRISVCMPQGMLHRFREHPGSHIYLSIPAAARALSAANPALHVLFEFLFNPFTVAAVDGNSRSITLVARTHKGPMTAAFTSFARVEKAHLEGGTIPLNIEGPYGVAKHFSRLASGRFDRVLLVAGGVGATFTVPLYKSLRDDSPNVKVEMVWSVRGAADATWAVVAGEDRSILEDDNVHIYLTEDLFNDRFRSRSDYYVTQSRSRSRVKSSSVEPLERVTDGTAVVEMETLRRDRRRASNMTLSHSMRRPDLKKVVGDVFAHAQDERVAVLVCGPIEMGREMRRHVGVYVGRGRVVWFHNETFGW